MYKGESMIGWYHKESLQGMVKELNWPNNIFGSFYIYLILHFFSHVYPLHAKTHEIKISLE